MTVLHERLAVSGDRIDRKIDVLGVHPIGECQVKLYGALHGAPGAEAISAEEARDAAARALQAEMSDCAIGFAVMRKEADGIDVFAGGWSGGEASLMQRAVRLGEAVLPINATPLAVSAVVAHEIEAFLAALETHGDRSDVEATYLADWYGGDGPVVPEATMRTTLARFAQSWARGDIDGLMEAMSAAPSYRTSGGAQFDGPDAVREGLAKICKPAPEGTPPPKLPEEIYFFGNKSLSYWSLPLPGADGETAEVLGLDVITYDDAGRIAVKDAYRKLR
ncbi:nuclear transport factor 2 family protein [Methyloligella sp. 2.7D]|uniref:nuclear transport factor 2 family protein n=1 Tax=unclassified Methyloligella TaxID=2625955 RepID=UPI00157D3985|nr:nuclear transport factor 2 family protein [Methyloligella sp. GL2]QKP76944.1 nuclear transport factor 2 family protein [Methyloligella sp. GL2]